MNYLMISDKADVLLLDDLAESLHVLVDLLSEAFQVHPFTDPAQFVAYIESGKPVDLILLDVVMPVRDGYDICAWLRGRQALEHVPIIFLSSLNSDEDERKGLQLGANDYISKPFSPAIVHARVRHHVELGRSLRIIADQNNNLDELVRMRTSELQFQATHDTLTRLSNRRHLEGRLRDAQARAQSGTLVLFQLNGLRPVLESLGYAFADRVLTLIGERLEAVVRTPGNAGIVHRVEGALFALFLAQSAGAGDVLAFLERLGKAMQQPFMLDGREMFFSFCSGIGHFPADGASVDDLLRNAHTALQNAVRVGPGAALFYEQQMSAKLLERMELEHELRNTVERGELELHYQPQLQIDGGRIIGVEALVRWRHPLKGMIPPGQFIPIAEETGAINGIGAWVVATACAQNKQWQRDGFAPIVMAVNLSPRQFVDPDLPIQIERVLRDTELDPRWLEIEVTEGAMMHDIEAAIASLKAFHEIGVNISIDDFGTGFSSLAYLARFPLDKLKVDQSFVRKLGNSDNDRDGAIVRAIIGLSRSLNLKVIAEGVETEEQRVLLAGYGCDEFQGYLFSRARPAAGLRAMLEAQSNTVSNIEEK